MKHLWVLETGCVIFLYKGNVQKSHKKENQYIEIEVQLTNSSEKRQEEKSLNNNVKSTCSSPILHKQELLKLQI